MVSKQLDRVVLFSTMKWWIALRIKPKKKQQKNPTHTDTNKQTKKDIVHKNDVEDHTMHRVGAGG